MTKQTKISDFIFYDIADLTQEERENLREFINKTIRIDLTSIDSYLLISFAHTTSTGNCKFTFFSSPFL